MSELSRTLSTLTTEAANPDWAQIDTWPTARLVAGMIDADRGLYEAVAACTDAITAAVDGIVARRDVLAAPFSTLKAELVRRIRGTDR